MENLEIKTINATFGDSMLGANDLRIWISGNKEMRGKIIYNFDKLVKEFGDSNDAFLFAVIEELQDALNQSQQKKQTNLN